VDFGRSRGREELASAETKCAGIWWDGYSLAPTGGAIIENYPAAHAGDGLAEEMLKLEIGIRLSGR
jgi:hypothetical protein